MNRIILLVLLLTFSVQAQTIEKPKLMVEYLMYDNTRYSEYKSVLWVNETESIFSINKSIDNGKEKDGNTIFIGGKVKDFYCYTDRNKDKLISVEHLGKKDLVKTVEEIPKLKWDLSNVMTKKIGNYTCNKATVYFRGRMYIVWYTKEIPSYFGVWKLHGLPGLMLSVEDTKGMYRWEVTKIKTKDLKSFSIPHKNLKEMDLIKYVEASDKYINELSKIIQSKLKSKGVKLSNKERRVYNLQTAYEWEK